MDCQHVQVSPSKDVLIALKHTPLQFTFILHEQGIGVVDLIHVV